MGMFFIGGEWIDLHFPTWLLLTELHFYVASETRITPLTFINVGTYLRAPSRMIWSWQKGPWGSAASFDEGYYPRNGYLSHSAEGGFYVHIKSKYKQNRQGLHLGQNSGADCADISFVIVYLRRREK